MDEFYQNDENQAANTSLNQNEIAENSRISQASQLSKPNLGQKSKPSFAKATSKPNFGFSKKI